MQNSKLLQKDLLVLVVRVSLPLLSQLTDNKLDDKIVKKVLSLLPPSNLTPKELLINALEELSQMTDTKIDDFFVNKIKKFFED